MPALRKLCVREHYMGALPAWLPELRLTRLTLSCGQIALIDAQSESLSANESQPPAPGATLASAMTMRWAEEKDVADMLERRRCSFYEWLYDDDTRLPTTMEILDIEMPSSFLNDTLPGGGELTFLERRRQVNAELAQNCQDELPP